MGLPMTGQIVALIQQLFPDSEPKRKIREFFYGLPGEELSKSKVNWFGQDRELGSLLADAATDGLANTGPVNVGNRFQLGVLMGVDPYKGFDWKNIVGPSSGIVENYIKAAQQASQGQLGEAAMTAIPNTNVRRLAQLASNGWKIRNQDERLNVDLTTSEAGLQALGFTPRRVAEFQQLNAMQKRAEAVHSLDQKQFNESMAEKVMSGDITSVQSALLARAQSVENYDPREGARQIAQVVQQRTLPFDPTRTGSRTGRTYDVGHLYPRTPDMSNTEVARLFQMHDLARSIGFPSPVTKGETTEATLVDQLLATNPKMTVVEAKAMLTRVMSRNPYLDRNPQGQTQ